MVEIAVGPELDRAVAKAVGWKCKLQVGYRDRVTGKELKRAYYGGFDLLAIREPILEEVDADTGGKYIPRYSTDLNAAFAAAETVGLFDSYALAQLNGQWRVTPATQGLWFADPAVGQGDTPALAICAAILERENDNETA